MGSVWDVLNPPKSEDAADQMRAFINDLNDIASNAAERQNAFLIDLDSAFKADGEDQLQKMEAEIEEASVKAGEEIRARYEKERPAAWNENKVSKALRSFASEI